METERLNLSAMENAALDFLHKAASCYVPQPGIQDTVLEVYFTDLCRTYQLALGPGGCTVLTEAFLPFTARAETAYPVFADLISGRKSPAIALLKGQVKTKGDLRILKRLEELFPGLQA